MYIFFDSVIVAAESKMCWVPGNNIYVISMVDKNKTYFSSDFISDMIIVWIASIVHATHTHTHIYIYMQCLELQKMSDKMADGAINGPKFGIVTHYTWLLIKTSILWQNWIY